MTYDFKNGRWKCDIDSFGRWKKLLEGVLHKEGDFFDRHRELIREYMRTIQQRWPQFIKEDEIP